jgi:hypothetical protein
MSAKGRQKGRYTPNNGHTVAPQRTPLWAIFDQSASQQNTSIKSLLLVIPGPDDAGRPLSPPGREDADHLGARGIASLGGKLSKSSRLEWRLCRPAWRHPESRPAGTGLKGYKCIRAE